MNDELTQSEVEWLRCLSVSRRFAPLLPEAVLRKLERARLVETRSGTAHLTHPGPDFLRAH